MRKTILFALIAVLGWSSCSNDFEIGAPWKSIPVIYGILSPVDTAHYLRIEKAFIDPTVSALAVAQIPDSLYFAPGEIAVYLQKVGSQQRYLLNRVDGNLEGFVRDSGIFAESPNWLYKITDDQLGGLEPGATYRVILERNDGSPAVTAETTIPDGFFISTPNPSQIPPKIGFSQSRTTTVAWRTDVNGLYFNVTLLLRYREEDAFGNFLNRDTITWFAARNVKRNANPSGGGGVYAGTTELSGQAFVNLLLDSIEPSSSRFRYFEGVDIQLEGGGLELEEYLLTQQANAGLTGAEILPSYTNLEPEGLGIVTGMNFFQMKNILTTTATVDSLNVRNETRALNFRY